MVFIICPTQGFIRLDPPGKFENAMYVMDSILLAKQCSLGVSIQIESGRIIIDPHTFSIYGMPGPNLASIESDSLTDSDAESSFNGLDNVIYQATSKAYRDYQTVLEKYENHRESDLSVRCKFASHLLALKTIVINFRTSQNSDSQATIALYSDYSRLLPYVQVLG